MSHRRSAIALTAALLALAAGTAQAQMYRSVGPDGRVTYSDKPPASANLSQQTAGSSGGAGSGGSALPYELNRVTQRYPVTLYTGKDCAPCNSGRNLLVNRGIPFSEKTVTTNDDIAALKRLGGDGSLPMLTIGGQRLTGFADADWSRYLDAAGYPQTSQLPSGYQRPAAAPLVTVKAVPAPAANAGTAAATAAPAEAAPTVSPARRNADNPAGIRF